MRVVRYCFVLLVGFLSCAVVQAQQPFNGSIQITPQSGPPGTVVTVIEVGSTVQIICSVQLNAGKAQIGTLPGAISYTIPDSERPGTALTFQCQGINPPTPSNAVSFQVTQPPVADSDGDGVPDNQDQCPNQSGSAANGGCPLVAHVDSDGDGIADDADACPAQAGDATNNGCPAVNLPAPADSDGDGILDSADSCPNNAGPASNGGCPAPSLPALPTSGQCTLATQGAARVNIRQGTSTDTAIVGQIDPSQTYAVIGRNADGSWLQIAQGWVAAFVTRQGGNCAGLPQTDGVVNPAPDTNTADNVGEPLPAPDNPDTTASNDLTNGSEPVNMALLLPAINAAVSSSCTNRCSVSNPDEILAALPFLTNGSSAATAGDGTTEPFFTVEISEGRITDAVSTSLVTVSRANQVDPSRFQYVADVVLTNAGGASHDEGIGAVAAFMIADPMGVETITLPNVGYIIWGDSTESQIPFVLAPAGIPTHDQLLPVLQILEASSVNTNAFAIVDMQSADGSVLLERKDPNAASGEWAWMDLMQIDLPNLDTDPLLWLVNDDGSVESTSGINALIALSQIQ